jgi:uncharacterized protein (DUF58 family)
MIPSRFLIWLAVLLVIPLMLGGMNRNLGDTALLLNLLVVLAAGVDLLVSPSPRQIEIEREVSEVLSVGMSNPAALQLRNRSTMKLAVSVHDDAGEMCDVEDLPTIVTIEPQHSEVVRYHIRPRHRGASALLNVSIRFPTLFGLWIRHETRSIELPVRIYPDIRAVYRYELLASRNRLAEIGVRIMQMPGQGREFERLREYRYGDEIRHIDWKATARQRELITREFNVERNQSLVLMVDCGRFMKTESGGISYLDQALNSAIMLSYIALGQSDNVSLMAFSNKIERFIRPVRGKPGIQTIIRSTYDIQPSDKAADYNLALEYLATVQRKRALVVLITFVSDEVQLQRIAESLRVRSLPYLPVCVLLQDVDLQNMAEDVPSSLLEAYHTAAAANILNGQSQQVTSLRESGTMVVSTPPQQLTERLISEYLTIKARHQM